MIVASAKHRSESTNSLEATLGIELSSIFSAGKVARVKLAGESRLLTTSELIRTIACFRHSTIPDTTQTRTHKTYI